MEGKEPFARYIGDSPAPRQLTVAHVHTLLAGTGGDRVSELEASYLVGRGHRVVMVAPAAPAIAARLRAAGVEIYDVPPPRRTARPAGRALGKLDIVHCHCMVSAPFAAELAGATGAALVIHNHSIGEEWWEARSLRSWLRPARRRRRRAIGKAIAWAGRVLCVSEPVREHMRTLGLRTDRADVVPNPISAAFAAPARDTAVAYDICVVARATRQKRPLTTLRILAGAKRIDPRLRIVWIGDLGRWRKIMRAAVVLLGLRDIAFQGAVDPGRVRAVLDSSRVLLSASKQEGFGLAVLEALARGCSVLLSDIPAHRAAFAHVAGTRFFARNAVKPAARMLVDLVSRHERTPREWLANQHSVERHGRNIERIYYELLPKPDADVLPDSPVDSLAS
jgi:glycosyltransferase involved in cell wall biosynthesis